MVVCSIVFTARIPGVPRDHGYDLCRLDVLEQRSHRQRHLFTFRFKLRDDGRCVVTDEMPFQFLMGASFNHPTLVELVRESKDLANTMVSRLNPLTVNP